MEKGIKKNEKSPGSVFGLVPFPRPGKSLGIDLVSAKTFTCDLQKGTRFRYRPTGALFEVKKITNRFLILNSIGGSRQIMTEKNNFTSLFEFEKFLPVKPTQ